jgi:ABC-2 type transport system ATP-binding protein
LARQEPIALELCGLEKSFGPVAALRGVSATLEGGLLHGLIGPDGAGKTTLMRVMMGLLKPSAGDILASQGGRALGLEEARAGMAYMPQSQNLYQDLSVSEHLDFFRDLYQLPRADYAKRRARLLAMTRLGAFQDRPAGKLSGGMYKKLGLMLAMLAEPQLLLLDEPTNGVDPISRREFWDLLYEQVAQGVTVAVSTAYMDEAERCGKVHLLMEGRLLASGEPRSLLKEHGIGHLDQLFSSGAAHAGS